MNLIVSKVQGKKTKIKIKKVLFYELNILYLHPHLEKILKTG
jgi:hypothetical protein